MEANRKEVNTMLFYAWDIYKTYPDGWIDLESEREEFIGRILLSYDKIIEYLKNLGCSDIRCPDPSYISGLDMLTGIEYRAYIVN